MPKTRTSACRLIATGLCCLSLAWTAIEASGQTASDEPTGLSLEQQSLAGRFERLESVATRLAELAASSEPERAEQLRRAIKASREKGLTEQFDAIIGLLNQQRLSAAAKNQIELKAELEALLQVLLEDPNNAQRDAMKKFLNEQIRELGKLIRRQRALRSETDATKPTGQQPGKRSKDLADKQDKLHSKAGEVQQKLNESNSSANPSDESPQAPSDSQNDGQSQPTPNSESGQPTQPSGQGEPAPPSADPIERAAQRVEQAQRAMQRAQQKLREAKEKGASEDQLRAQRELEAARAELERVLRQLREEEMSQLLTKLAARFRGMLAAQKLIYEETVAIAEKQVGGAARELMLQSIRLSRREADLVRDAEKALTLLREDGTSVAFPEIAAQIVDDMTSVTARLAAADTGPITQTVELDIIAGLEDMVAALDKARDELANQQGSPQPGQASGSPGETSLVPKIAELRMIRTLQARVYKRTQQLGDLANNPNVQADDLSTELEKLSTRQQSIFQATRDLDTRANQ